MSETTHDAQWIGESKSPSVWLTRYSWTLVLGALALAYVLSNFLIPKINDAELELYVARPMIWLCIGGLVMWLRQLNYRDEPLFFNLPLTLTATAFGAVQISVLLLAGLFIGFGFSPYSHRFVYIILNLWFVFTQLVGLELARWYLVKSLGAHRMFISIVVTWLVFTIILIPIGGLHQYGEIKSAFRYTGQFVMPITTESLLATYLVFAGGPGASIGYRGILLLFEWLSPVLPDLTWITQAFIGTIVPALGIIFVYSFFLTEETEEETTEKESSSLISWVLVAIFAIILFAFNTGIFGVQPSLVSGFSMKPTFVAGDVVVSRDVPVETIKVNDIIRFKEQGVYVLHRVLDIQTDENGSRVFLTQGDNNRDVDPLVTEDRLAGKIIFIVPKLGWVSIWVREMIPAFGKVNR